MKLEQIYLSISDEDHIMRTCTKCNSKMVKGYCVTDGEEYYCSDTCLYADGYTEGQKDIDYENGLIYWTEWEE